MTKEELVERGRRAMHIIESEEWREAWNAYRETLLREIESCSAKDAESVMHCKRLLSAANAARVQLERMMTDGIVAAKELEVFSRRQKVVKNIRNWL